MTAGSGIGSDALFRFSSICLKITRRQTPTVWHQSRRQFTVTKRPKKSQQILIKITGTCNYFDQAKLGVTTAPLRDDDDDNLLIGKLSETLCQSKKTPGRGSFGGRRGVYSTDNLQQDKLQRALNTALKYVITTRKSSSRWKGGAALSPETLTEAGCGLGFRWLSGKR